MLPDYVNEPSAGYLQIATDSVVNFGTAWEAANPGSLLAARRYVFLLQAENALIRWRDDGTNPTSSVGMPLNQNAQFLYTGYNPENLRFIGAAGILNVLGWRVR